MRTLLTIGAVALALLDPPTSPVVPTGWIGLADTTGRCFYAVPPGWKAEQSSDTAGTLATSPDGRVKTTLVWAPYATWPAFTSQVKADLRPTLVHEDAGRRLWVEYRSSWPGIHHYAAVPATGGGCVVFVDTPEEAAEGLRTLTRTIIESATGLK
ncbi:MAG: hypothetical protein ACHQO8_11010 [Vicinamibacterales bacterium]